MGRRAGLLRPPTPQLNKTSGEAVVMALILIVCSNKEEVKFCVIPAGAVLLVKSPTGQKEDDVQRSHADRAAWEYLSPFILAHCPVFPAVLSLLPVTWIWCF